MEDSGRLLRLKNSLEDALYELIGEGSFRPLARRFVLALAVPCLLHCPPLLRPASAKIFVDPRFILDLPDGFVVSKRTATTGTIFVAGNFPRFTVVSATAWPLATLLQDDAKGRDLPGLPSTAVRLNAGATSLLELGSAKEVAQLLIRQRDREASNGALQSELVDCTFEGDRLEFRYSTESPVADPDALEKERGVRRLLRQTACASVIGSVPTADGKRETAIFSVFGSALEQDWDKDLQEPLERAVKSFNLVTADAAGAVSDGAGRSAAASSAARIAVLAA